MLSYSAIHTLLSNAYATLLSDMHANDLVRTRFGEIFVGCYVTQQCSHDSAEHASTCKCDQCLTINGETEICVGFCRMF